VQPLQNVLSISTAGKNRYLLHFNSLHSLTQWTAGIRLAMFEHASLQELYTGSLIAGKGKKLNNIRVIMERTRLKTEDWARVRFGAGTPWRRCWCVIEPPDEKDFQKLQKTIKKRSAYERPPVLKGVIKFYDAKKTKKAMPIATITDAYSAYAIYPQAKPLIDQSTLVKVEGRITIHSQPESKTEGFVFVMPEAHPGVTGFEMMLRWLFPVYDTFSLYGRPRSLIADTLDPRGLMFAMPKQKRYGYLEIIDVAGLIHADGSKDWSEREWRKQMKELTSRRMEMRRTAPSREGSQLGGRRGPRTSLPARPGDFRYDDNVSIRSTPSTSHQNNQSTEADFATPQKAGTAPPGGPFPPPANNYHTRAVSESVAFPSPSRSNRQKDSYVPSRLSTDHEFIETQAGPQPPNQRLPSRNGQPSLESQHGRDSSDSERRQTSRGAPGDIRNDLPAAAPTGPVTAPPAFAHQEGDRPQTRPQASPDMRRANSRMSTATLSQMVDATGMRPINGEAAAAGAVAAWNTRNGGRGEGGAVSGVNETPQRREMTADQGVSPEGVVGGKPFEEGQIPNNQTALNLLHPPPNKSRSSSAKSITRKALPSQTATDSYLASVTKESGTGASIIAASARPDDHYSTQQDQVQTLPDQHSHHDKGVNDENISYSPRNASTQEFNRLQDSNNSDTRTRTGVLKSVGDPMPPMPLREAPTIDFGPTASLTPLPGGDLSKSESRHVNALRNQYDHPRDNATPLAQTNGQRSSSYGKSSPVEGSDSRPNLHSRSASFDKRTMAWQPGAVIGAGRQSPSPAITPEEFVQWRASANRTPSGYVPQRSRSSGYFGVDRPISGEWSKKKDNPSRPQSRGPSPTMNQQQDYSSRLSAHEQEHLARMTGSPLINVPRKSENQAGLIGAIHAREQEKRNMRDGVSGQMVQHAIAQRHQQAQAQVQAQQAAQVAYGYPQQNQGYQDGRGQLISAATWSPQQQLGQNAQWTGHYAQGQTGNNLPQQNPSQQYNPSYTGYYGQQNGYQG
jgi:CCR4-NOT transcriptional complex subunit CAF120